MAVFPTGTAADSDLYIGVNNLSTVLDGAIGAGDTTITVSSTTGFPTVGIITIDLEAIHYTGTTATTFTGCTRGFDGTTGAAHADTTTVFHDIPAAHHNVLKDEIIAIETYLKDVLDETGNGDANGPAYSFGGDTDTGFFWSSSGTVGFSSNTTNTVLFTDGGIRITTGSESLPSITFSGDPDTGFYQSAAGTVSFSGNASQSLLLTDGGLRIADGTEAIPSISFLSDIDTGIYWPSANEIRVTTNATDTFAFGASNVTYADLNPSADNTHALGTSSLGYTRLFASSGSAAAPAITTAGDADTGAGRTAADTYTISTGGNRALEATSTQAVNIKGTSTNDNAASGDYGEALRSYATSVAAAATNTYGNITSITLGAGDWDVSGIATANVIGTVTRSIFALSAFSGNTTTDHANADNVIDGDLPTGSSNGGAAIPVWRVSVSSSTTIYLKARLTYASGSPTLDGRISARRVR